MRVEFDSKEVENMKNAHEALKIMEKLKPLGVVVTTASGTRYRLMAVGVYDRIPASTASVPYPRASTKKARVPGLVKVTLGERLILETEGGGKWVTTPVVSASLIT